MSRFTYLLSTGILFALILAACGDDEMIDPNPPIGGDIDLTDIPYSPQPYNLVIPDSFPPMSIPADNPLTEAGVQLGRFLFYDPILSGDSSLACVGCHLIEGSFTDNQAVSKGITGETGTRSAMSLLNVGFYNNGLFWDGRAQTLEEQALLPVEDPIEMHALWPDVVDKLKTHPDYPERFRKAFGIEKASEITKELTAKALAQFERIIISSGTSRFDKRFLYLNPTVDLSDSEQRGFDMFFDEPNSPLPDAQCFHCHGGVLFTTNEYFNNGLQEAATLNDFGDPGRGAVTGNLIDNGKMRAPTLRNIMHSAPYMHDGRFATMEEVLDFYNEGVHYADNLDDNLIPEMGLSESEKQDIIA
ncbi:MAG: cytochrome C peroxidase, partial [Phaeodactylibacter sp.]|nr:cytochrome C peroxidase [Phaeodactylibacter sp.]